MADFKSAVACLSATYASWVTQEVARQTEKMASVVASFTDPLEALANANIKGAVDGVTSLAEGSITGGLVSLGEAIIVGRVKRELRDILQDVLQENPGIGNQIQRITNITEAVYGIVSLAVMLRKEAPYSAIKVMIDEINEILDIKESNLRQLRTHITQLNNVIQSVTDNPTKAANTLRKDVEAAASSLKEAATRLIILETSMAAIPSVYVEKEYTAAVAAINAAETNLCPPIETNILDVTAPIAQGLVGSEFLTDSQIKLSSYAVKPLSILVNCEMVGVEKQTRRLNEYLSQLPEVVPNYEAAAESSNMKDFRIKLVRQLRLRVQKLQKDMEAALTPDSLDKLALHSVSWCARLGAIQEMTPKVTDRLAAASTDQSRFDQMQNELADMLASIASINSQNVTDGFEDLTAMKSQVGTLQKQGSALAQLLGTGRIDQFDMRSFQITAHTLAVGGNSTIQESLDAIGAIRASLTLYQTYPPADQQIEDMLSLLELMGMDRAKDLLKSGKFSDFLNTSIDDASYIGIAINCLISTEKIIEDTVTLQAVTQIREALEGQRISELAAAFDIIDSGKNAAILEISTYIENAQANYEKVKNVIQVLTDLGEKGGETIDALDAAATGLSDQLGDISTGAGGPLNPTLADLDVDGLQGGCAGQLRF